MQLGVRYMLASAFFFSVMTLCVKVAGWHLPSQEIVWARGLMTTIFTYGMLRRAGLSPWGIRPGILLIRGLVGFVALMCFYFVLTELPIAEATVLQYTSPIWTSLIAVPLLGEKISPRVLGAGLVSFAGVALIARPGFLFGELSSDLNLMAVGIALVGALFSAGAYVAIREASKTDHAFVIIYYFALVSAIGPLPVVASGFVWPRGVDWLALLGVGVVTQIAQVCLTRGLSLVPAGRAMTIAYTQILFASLWGALFFAEYPDSWTVVGAVLVIVGAAAVSKSPGDSNTPRRGIETGATKADSMRPH
jgi:drug/metabolite transporter (DMT)-like permease